MYEKNEERSHIYYAMWHICYTKFTGMLQQWTTYGFIMFERVCVCASVYARYVFLHWILSYTCTQNHSSLCAALLFSYTINLKDSTKAATKIKEAKKEEKEGYLLLWPVSGILLLLLLLVPLPCFRFIWPVAAITLHYSSLPAHSVFNLFDLALCAWCTYVCCVRRACISSIRSLLLLYCGSSFVVHFGLLLFVDDGRRRKCNSSVRARNERRRNNFF